MKGHGDIDTFKSDFLMTDCSRIGEMDSSDKFQKSIRHDPNPRIHCMESALTLEQN
jgi:hypothetical protein